MFSAQTAEKAAKQAEGVNAFGFRNGTLHLGAENVVVRSGVKELETISADDAVGVLDGYSGL